MNKTKFSKTIQRISGNFLSEIYHNFKKLITLLTVLTIQSTGENLSNYIDGAILTLVLKPEKYRN